MGREICSVERCRTCHGICHISDPLFESLKTGPGNDLDDTAIFHGLFLRYRDILAPSPPPLPPPPSGNITPEKRFSCCLTITMKGAGGPTIPWKKLHFSACLLLYSIVLPVASGVSPHKAGCFDCAAEHRSHSQASSHASSGASPAASPPTSPPRAANAPATAQQATGTAPGGALNLARGPASNLAAHPPPSTAPGLGMQQPIGPPASSTWHRSNTPPPGSVAYRQVSPLHGIAPLESMGVGQSFAAHRPATPPGGFSTHSSTNSPGGFASHQLAQGFASERPRTPSDGFSTTSSMTSPRGAASHHQPGPRSGLNQPSPRSRAGSSSRAPNPNPSISRDRTPDRSRENSGWISPGSSEASWSHPGSMSNHPALQHGAGVRTPRPSLSTDSFLQSRSNSPALSPYRYAGFAHPFHERPPTPTAAAITSGVHSRSNLQNWVAYHAMPPPTARGTSAHPPPAHGAAPAQHQPPHEDHLPRPQPAQRQSSDRSFPPPTSMQPMYHASPGTRPSIQAPRPMRPETHSPLPPHQGVPPSPQQRTQRLPSVSSGSASTFSPRSEGASPRDSSPHGHTSLVLTPPPNEARPQERVSFLVARPEGFHDFQRSERVPPPLATAPSMLAPYESVSRMPSHTAIHFGEESRGQPSRFMFYGSGRTLSLHMPPGVDVKRVGDTTYHVG